MKKKLLIGFGSIISILLIALGTSYLLSFHKVSFEFQNDVTSATIYDSDKQELRRIDPNGSMFLKKGKYYAIPQGNSLSNDSINFTVEDKDMTVMIDPAYSKEYLKDLLTKEKSAIATAISAKYPSIFSQYTLTHETLYRRGDWSGGLLEPKVSDERDERDSYRVVLYKEDKTWKVVRRPEYILTSSKYEDVPVDVLRAINSIIE
jgi:uncharacterized protein YpmB